MIELVTDDDGVVLRRDACAAGVDDKTLGRLVRSGVLFRLRQGIYVDSARWRPLDQVGRHLVLSRAVMRLYDDDVALSHGSACAQRGGPTWRIDLDAVHLTSLSGRAHRTNARVVHHSGQCRVEDVTRVGGFWMTSPARSAMETAAIAGLDPAVAVLDWHLFRGLVTRELLERQFHQMQDWPDTLGLHRKLALADGGSQSVGESRSKLLFHRQRVPRPELQWSVLRADGTIAGISDFVWHEYRCMGEFDGMGKYQRLRRPGETIEQTVLREKRREDEMRELTGYRMIRFDWSDLGYEQQLASRVLDFLHRPMAA